MKGKKFLSFVLSIAMTLSMFSGLTMTSAQAAVGDAANNVWTASEADAGKTADTVLADDEKGTLTTLFDLTYADTLTDSEGVTTPISETVGDRTFTAYVTHPSMNGGFNNDGTIRTGYTTLFSYAPKADGVLTAYFMDVASSKKVCIVEDGAQNFKTGGSIVYTSGIDESMSVSAQLSAGKTYYFFVDGSKGRFMAVDYEVGAAYEQATPAPATAAPTLDPNAKIYEWEVSEADVNKKAGDLLMTGLSLVSDNAGTNKYVTAADNGDLVGGVATGSALKFVAPENGTISVTFKDLGNVDNFKTAHIYDATAGKAVASYTTKGEGKETFDLSVGVTEGSTYYIYANGTKARYSSAKFTPTSGAEETQAPATDAPVNTDAPAVNAIAYADGTVAVTLADVQTAVLIKSTYADGVLSGVTSYDLTFTNGVATQALEAAEGTKLMVWDSLKGMKPLCASYTVSANVDETDAPNETDVPKETTTPTETPSNLPKDVIFRADDTAFDNMFNLSEAATASNGLTVSAGIGSNNKKVAYTHNGTNYTFTRQWKHGNNTQTLTFTPATSCVVTVVFNGNGGVDRMVNISQNGTVLAQGFSTDTANTAAETVVADILDATAGDVVISGGGSNKNISAIFVEYYDATPDKAVTGTITNSTGEDLTAETIVFTNKADATDVVEMAYAENYSVNLTKGATYTISVKGKESTICPTISTAEITVTKNRNELTHNFELVKIGEVTVTGNVYTLSSHDLRTPAKAYDSAIGATLNFTKDGDTTPTTATVNADGTYSVSLLSNESYTVALANAEGYTLSALSTSYELLGGVENPKKNVLLMKDTADSVEYKDTLTVGADKDYPTVSDAVAAIRKMSRTNERVTIVVDSGVYTEQVYLDVNNVTLKSADETNPALISWYYGIGYEYYSAAKDGWYNADAAVAQTAKGMAQKWGGTVYVKGTNFLAENIKFQSTFNLEIVAQELADGVACGDKNYDRTAKDADPKSRAAVERAAAMLVEGANAEFYKCSFQSSQDTLWTGSSAAYFKECDIYGGTDYIFGGNSVVFDTCNLIWQGYSDQQAGGHITACKNGSTEDNGYLMLNCTVKNNTADSGQQFAQGSYGRNWGGANCKVIFLNTKLEGDAKVAKWVKMSGELAQSNLYVVNTIGADGNPVTLTSEDQPCGTLSAEEIAAIDPYDYFNGWTPVHYVGEDPVIPTATPTVAPTATPTVAPATSKWTVMNDGDNATITVGEEDESILTVASGNDRKFTYDLAKEIENFPTAYAGADGELIVSFDLKVNDTEFSHNNNWFIDLSTRNTDLLGWSGNDGYRFGRFAGYGLSYEKFVGGTAATNDSTGCVYENKTGFVKNEWKTVTFKVDLKNKNTFAGAYGDNVFHTVKMKSPSGLQDGQLYINIGFGGAVNADTTVRVKNVKVEYKETEIDTYTISDGTVTGEGTLSYSTTSARMGETVTVTAASSGVITAITANGTVNFEKVNDITYTFTMPAQDVTVDATFALGSVVKVTNPEVIKGGYISADAATIDSKEDVITLTAKLWDGITTVDWNVTYGENGKYTVTDTVVTGDSATATINLSSVEDFTVGDEISVSAEFGAGADAKVLYFADVTPDESKHLEKKNGIVHLGYVKSGNLLKSWTVEGGNFYTLENGKKLKTATFYATKGNTSNTATMSNGTTASANTVDMYTNGETVTVYDNTGTAKTDYSKVSCDVSDLTAVAGSENTIYWKNSGGSSWCGNWLYIILNYEATGETPFVPAE